MTRTKARAEGKGRRFKLAWLHGSDMSWHHKDSKQHIEGDVEGNVSGLLGILTLGDVGL